MLKFFAKIFKQKKTLLFTVFLFLTLLFLTLPQPAYADVPGGLVGGMLGGIFGPVGAALGTLVGSFGEVPGAGAVTEAVLSPFFNALIFALTAIPLALTTLLSLIFGGLLTNIIGQMTTNLGYTDTAAVKAAWPLVRNMANMVIVLGFVLIGIATALRIKQYEAKVLLKNLIIAALLINFSILICGIAIDASNILVNYFLKGDSFVGVTNSVSFTATKDLLSGILKNPNPIAFLFKTLSVIFYNIVVLVILAMYAFLFIFRFFALQILVILSPLAFVFSVFPYTNKYFRTWLDNFTQWCLLGAAGSFFVWLSNKTMGTLSAQTFNIDFKDTASVVKSLGNMYSTLTPAFFLIIGFMVSLQFSAMGSGIVKWAGQKAKVGGLALGRAVGVNTGRAGKQISRLGSYMEGKGGATGVAGTIFKGAGKLAGAAGGGGATLQKTRSALGRGLEAVGAIPRGSTGSADADAVEKEAKGLKIEYEKAKLNNDRTTIERIRTEARTGQGAKGAAAYKVVSDSKDLTDTFKDAAGNPNFNAIYTRGKWAENAGAQGVIKENEKLNPAYRRNNEYELEEKAKTMYAGVPNAHNDPLFRPLIQDAVEADGFKKATPAEIKNYHKSVLQSKTFIENVRTKALERAANTELSDEQATATRAHIPYMQAEMKNCYIAGSNVVDPAKSDRYNELKRKLRVISTM